MDFFDTILAFFGGSGFWVYAFIFLGKIVEVTISTLRIVLINRGERTIGCILALFEITLWVIVTGSVLNGFQEDFIKVIVYVVAFASGCYLGSFLEEKLAFGLCSISIFAPTEDEANKLAYHLRENNYAVTVMDAEGIDHARRFVLMLIVRRKTNPDVVRLVKEVTSQAVITITNISSFKGGYLHHISARRRFPLLGAPYRKRRKKSEE